MADDLAPIIVKKIKKGGHGAHGGAWKVAYADFVTAMMAFFLLLWLLNVTTTEQKEGLADYFAPTTASLSQSGAGGVMGGTSMQTEGAQISNLGVPSAVSSISPPDNGRKGESEDARKTREMEEAELLEKLRQIEEASFEQARDQIRQAINKDPELSGLKDNIIIDMTPEGLRIQIVDQFNESMFESGSSKITPRVQSLVGKIAKSIEELPNSLSISGHTDSSSFNGGDYSNWELSSDRANASRRALLDAGLKPDRIEKVAGRADTDPLIADDPSNPGNRRISIILLRETPVLPPNLK